MMETEPQRRARIPATERLLDAVSRGQGRRAREAVEDGADVEARYPAGSAIPGWTPGMLAAIKLGRAGNLPVDEAAYEELLGLCDPDARDAHGLTALMRAASELNMRSIEILAARSDLDAAVQGGRDGALRGWPALFFALNAHAGSGQAERLLDLLGTPANLRARSSKGLDAELAALRGGSPEAAAAVARRRAALDEAEELGRSVAPARGPSKGKPAL